MIKGNLFLLLFCQLYFNNTPYAFAENLAKKQNKVGQLVRQTNLLKSPDNKSEVITVLEAKKNITIKSRQRAWYLILSIESSSKSSSKSSDYNLTNNKSTDLPLKGWVSMLNVRFLAQAKREGELGLSTAFSSITKGSLPTVSTGVRGFDDNDLKKSQANFKQVELLDSFTVSKVSARRFAQSVDLPSENSNREQIK